MSSAPERHSTTRERELRGWPREKKAILVLASGGVFSEGPWKSWDTVEPYLRQILGFIGIDDVQDGARARHEHTGAFVSAIPNGEKTITTSHSEGEIVINHIILTVSNIERSLAFYDAL